MSTPEKQAAFEFIKPKVPSIKQRILNALKSSKKGLSSKELCLFLNIKIQTVAGRLDELQDAGIVTSVSESRKDTKHFFVSDPNMQKKFARKRSEDKFYADLAKWKNRYSDILSKETFETIELEADANFKERSHV